MQGLVQSAASAVQRSRWAEVLDPARRTVPSASSRLFLFHLSETKRSLSLSLYFACSQRVTFRYAIKRKGSDIRSFFSELVDKRARIEESSKGPSQPLPSGNVPALATLPEPAPECEVISSHSSSDSSLPGFPVSHAKPTESSSTGPATEYYIFYICGNFVTYKYLLVVE